MNDTTPAATPDSSDLTEKISSTERKITELSLELAKLRKQQNANKLAASSDSGAVEYTFESTEGPVSMSQLFGEHDTLFIIHNMGQGCRYCTLWGDGLNPFVSHLESVAGIAMVSGDDPGMQRRFSNSRQWRFRMLSHGKGDYYREQVVSPEYENCPGIACYKRIDGNIYRIAGAEFGPGDLYCSLWHVLSLAGMGVEDWTPQYRYWSKPEKLEDGGNNIQD